MTTSNLLQIDRSKRFDLRNLDKICSWVDIDEGWSIAEEDKRVLSLTEIDLSKMSFNTLPYKSCYNKIKEQLVASGRALLDVQVFQILWENQSLIPESWKSGGYIHFGGTEFERRNCRGRYILFMAWGGAGWLDGYTWIGEFEKWPCDDDDNDYWPTNLLVSLDSSLG